MKKILIFAFWFGKLPNYFELWLKTVKYNKTIDFIFFTDSYVKGSPDNLKLVNISFDDISQKVKSKFDVDIVLDKPYKLCEYRCGFGYIFPEYIQGYDFWGHCDIDTIFGDLRYFLNDEKLNYYEKINTLAHLTIYKNSEKTNKLFMKNHKYSCYTFEDARKTKYTCFLDEWGGVSAYAPMFNVKQLDEVVYGDIDPFSFQFRLIGYKFNYNNQIFEWNEGKLYLVYINENSNSIEKEEVEYIHLQKRKMELTGGIDEKFLIIPNKFLPYSKLSINDVVEYTKDINIKYGKMIKRNETLKKLNFLNLKNKIFRIYKLIFFDHTCRPFIRKNSIKEEKI